MSKTLYKAFGSDIGKAFQDGTHHNAYGSYELAQCVLLGIQQNKLDLAKSIKDEWKAFDPAHPDPIASLKIPPQPQILNNAAPRKLIHVTHPKISPFSGGPEGRAFLLFTLITTSAPASPVTITDKGQDYILSNSTLTARIDKHSGTLFSLTFNSIETLAGVAYWSHSAASPQTIDSITIDPTKNNGQRGEVSIKGNCQGKPVGGGPGGSAIADIEIRYTLAAGDSGIYTYSIWTHKPDYPTTSVGEARFCAKAQRLRF